MKYRILAAISFLGCIGTANAVPIIINPTSDGALYACDGCNVVSDGAYVLADGYIQGAVKFSSAGIDGTVQSARLSLNPYGLPLWGPSVSVYGYGTSIGALDVSDADAGTFLGVLALPPGLGFGEDAFFDVTNFVASTNAAYLAFNLRTPSGGTDVFSSLEYNYGHPSQLILDVTPYGVPEPSTLALFASAILAVFIVSRRRVGTR